MSDPRRRRSLVTSACALVAITGCGASVGTKESQPQPVIVPADPTTPPPVKEADPVTPAPDHGSVSTSYPAFKPSVPQIIRKPGRILKNPVIVTVTWNDDPNVVALEGVGDQIGASSYWKEIVAEYGVGPTTSGAANHVHLATPIVLPTGANDDTGKPIVDLITNALTNTTASGWPAPTDQTLYLVYLHGANADTLCRSGAGGYHDDLKVGALNIPFAVTAACSSKGSPTSALDSATITATHEIAEAATDPLPTTASAWSGLQDADLAWELLQSGQDENGDMCEFYDGVEGTFGLPQLAFPVQRQWSNAAALAGHSPCVPQPKAETNINVAPLDTFDTVTAKLDPRQIPFNPESKGYVVAAGGTRKIPLGLYSDGPTSGFAIEAFEASAFNFDGSPFDPTRTPLLTVALDRTSGQNGEKAYLSVTVNSVAPEKVHLVVVRSTLGATVHYMPILIGDNGAPGKHAVQARKLFSDGRHGAAWHRVSRSTSLGRLAAWGSRWGPDPDPR